MTLEEFGANLRAEREKKGVSIEEASNRLKISTRMLKAMEEGDTENFPHMAYAKGFMRSYAMYLGIPAEEISQAFASMTQMNNEVSFVSREETRGAVPLLSPLILQIGVLALFFGLIGGGIYLVWSNGWASQCYNWVVEKTQSFRKGSDSNARKESQKIPPLSSSLDEDSLLPKVPGNQTQSFSEQSQKSQETRLETQKDTSLLPNSQDMLGQHDSLSPLTDEHQVVIVADESCWVQSTSDGTDTRQFSLRKGDTFALSFRKKLEVKLGNAGGVHFRYNGQVLPAMGKSGQVKTVVFPPEGESE